MLYTLTKADGEEKNMTKDVWHGALKASLAAGWKATGTVLDGDQEWCGSYKGCSGQHITQEDAEALCEALADTQYQHVGRFIDAKKTYIF